MQQKKDQLRVGKKEPSQTEPNQPQEITVGSAEPENAKSQPEDYLAQLQQQAKQHKQRESESDSQPSVLIDAGNSNGSVETSPDDEMGQLQAKAKQMRERRNAAKTIKDLHSEDLGDKEDLGADTKA